MDEFPPRIPASAMYERIYFPPLVSGQTVHHPTFRCCHLNARSGKTLALPLAWGRSDLFRQVLNNTVFFLWATIRIFYLIFILRYWSSGSWINKIFYKLEKLVFLYELQLICLLTLLLVFSQAEMFISSILNILCLLSFKSHTEGSLTFRL